MMFGDCVCYPWNIQVPKMYHYWYEMFMCSLVIRRACSCFTTVRQFWIYSKVFWAQILSINFLYSSYFLEEKRNILKLPVPNHDTQVIHLRAEGSYLWPQNSKVRTLQEDTDMMSIPWCRIKQHWYLAKFLAGSVKLWIICDVMKPKMILG